MRLISRLATLTAAIILLPAATSHAQPLSGKRYALPLPPLPSAPKDGDPSFYRYDATKGKAANEATITKINAKVEAWNRRLASHDREVAARHMMNTTTESIASSDSFLGRVDILGNLNAWMALKARYGSESQCGASDDSQEVEFYDGLLGPSKQFVEQHNPSTGQIQWREDLASQFSGPGDNPGNVSGVRWCSGTLISERYFLTAAHCFFPSAGGWKTPHRTVDGVVSSVPADQLAKLMRVNFNYQRDRTTGMLRTPRVFPVVSLVEFGGEALDFAIVELGADGSGALPGSVFPAALVDASIPGSTNATPLTIFQHPNGSPKKVAAGKLFSVSGERLFYSDIDTMGGSSGSGVMTQGGKVVGVHTHGGCEPGGGSNGGVTTVAIKARSKIIK